ncbi:MAG: hypothetical protein VW810_03190 [Pelagibacteraceae bacterium]
MAKEDNINFKKFDTPNFDQINQIFQNNLKIYNNFFKENNTNGLKPKIRVKANNKSTQNNKQFTPIDLLNLINPTTTKITSTLFDATSRMSNNPALYYEHINKWIQQIASLNFYFISKLSNQPADPVVQPDKTDKRFSDTQWS